jgi:HK97 gp10 family phage protein
MADYSKYQWKTKVGTVRYGGKIGGISLDTSLLDQMTAEIADKASSLIHDVGMEIVNVVYELAPKDTGELARSYIEESGMTDKLMFTISDGVSYGIFQELGTSKMAAQPHVVPAMEDAEAELVKAFTELFE